MQDLVTLPRDIKHYILQFLTDPRDLYNLNLTCRELRHDALPFYYSSVHVNANVALPVLAAGLAPTNPGLQYLRHLVIKEPYRDDPIEFYICTSDPCEASFWNRVLPTLPNLRNLEIIASADRFDGVYPLTADASSEVLAKLLDWTSQKSHYKLHLHTLQTCLNALPSLRTLQMLDMRLYDAEAVRNDEDYVRGFLLRHTRTLADYVFSAMAHLKAFSFERFNYRHTNSNYWESCSGRCYHRGRIIDALGREQTTAIEASLQELKQIEPAVDILGMEDLEHGGLFRYGYEL
ncbi:hypothetical protein D0865_06475 [Hortaea werneckii]|uniref:F-box domain-containing protein n=1 Tax=Hortaea werneckii TaxID=91943 RepID=A0A3M7CHT7_HORWE|nr:hypothetical protein D0865_06475 [Hortaea werneckii]